MIDQESERLYRRWLFEFWHEDLAVVNDLVGPDFVGHWPDGVVRGPGELAATIKRTHAMFSHLSFSLDVGPIADHDLVAARWTGTGTTTDGATMFTGNDILRIADGRFVEYWPATVSGA